jgi:2-desacetyl-2-hydroxyethyl bacteriochlorophyllide A dehydrogenase
MRAAVMTEWNLTVEDVPDPVPRSGQVLAKVLACGICGSDLHLLKFGAEQIRLRNELMADTPPDPLAPIPFEPSQPLVMGHEFCCEIVELGPGTERARVGDVVVSMPGAFDDRGIHALGYSNLLPGGYSELMVLNDFLILPVPNGLAPRHAALTEPLAVGVHAVNKSRIDNGDAAIVLGCGPVGLAVIASLATRGIGPIVAADFSPARRRLAEHFGAHVVVDPREQSAIAAWRTADGQRPLVIFEAVGVPGMIDQAMRAAPRDARIVVVGVCMQQDHMQPMVGIARELNVQFVLAYTPEEFAATLDTIADGPLDLDPLITGTVGVDGVPQAFTDLADPEEHAKILVEPSRG